MKHPQLNNKGVPLHAYGVMAGRYLGAIMISSLFTLMLGCAGLAGSFGAGPMGLAAAPLSDDARAMNHYLTSQILRRQGRFEEALSHLRRAADLSSTPEPLYLELIEIYTRLENFEEAEALCRRAVSKYPENGVFRLRLGWILQRQDRYDEAIREFEAATRIDPSGVSGLAGLIMALEGAGDTVAAADTYEKLIELTPGAEMLRFAAGQNYLRMRDYEAARDAFRKVVELNPERNDARILLGVALLELEENEAAARELEAAIERAPERGDLLEILASAYARLGRLDEAIGLMDKLVSGEQATAKDRLQRMYLLLRAGRPAEAFEAAPPSGAPILATLFRALARREAGEPFDKIIESLDAAEGDADEECTEWLPRLLNFYGRSRASEFLPERIEALRQSGVNSQTLNLVAGRMYMFLEKHREAEEALRAGLEMGGNEYTFHYNLAVVYESLRDINGVERHLKECLREQPNSAELLNFLGYAYADFNVKLDEAEKLIEQALLQEPDSGYYLDSMGWVYYRRGDAAKAIDYIRRAIRNMDTDDAILRDHLGDAYLLNGEVEKAIAEWERALRLDKEIKGVAAKIEKHRPR